MWVNRKSEETFVLYSIGCYWAKSKLSRVGIHLRYMNLTSQTAAMTLIHVYARYSKIVYLLQMVSHTEKFNNFRHYETHTNIIEKFFKICLKPIV